jgi:hypothetical protein
MKRRGLFILVEGLTDSDFFEALLNKPEIKSILESKYEFSRVIRYKDAEKSWDKGKMRDFLYKTKSAGYDYIFFADINDAPCITRKKEVLLDTYNDLDREKIIIVVKEIESWFLAGMEEDLANKYKIDIPHSTENITKEDFIDKTKGRSLREIEFRQEILENFCLDAARVRNKSFAYFLRKLKEDP